MLTTTLLLALAAGAPASDVHAEATVPDTYLAGSPFEVELVYVGGEAGSSLETWRLGPAAFDLDGAPLGDRSGEAAIPLPAGATLTLRMDLAPHLPEEGGFELRLAGQETGKKVTAFTPAPEGLAFLDMPAEELGRYQVLMETNRGSMMLELLPEKAPNHVRNFLDLCASGFYEGVLFHRVSPDFMIQGGCPNTKTDRRNTWGTGSGPRMLEAEFNDTDHQRGVLSMARGQSKDSGSCQFFVMTKHSPFLNNQYSAFGRLVSGFETLDAIANAQGRRGPDGTIQPSEPQKILRTTVLVAGE